MPTTARVTIRTEVKSLTEGGSVQTEYTQSNTTGCRITAETTFGTGISSATSFRAPTNAKWVTIVMPSTNTNGWRLSATTAEPGIAMSSLGASVLSLSNDTAGQEFYAYTSSTRAISGVRIVYS